MKWVPVIAIVEKYNLNTKALVTLVTSHDQEPEVIAKAKELNVPILPKSELATIQLALD